MIDSTSTNGEVLNVAVHEYHVFLIRLDDPDTYGLSTGSLLIVVDSASQAEDDGVGSRGRHINLLLMDCTVLFIKSSSKDVFGIRMKQKLSEYEVLTILTKHS